MSSSQDEINKRLEKGLGSDIPQIYFNGFASGIGTGDVILVLERNGKPVATLNTSYSVAKTFALKINGLIQGLETKTENKIMTTDYLADSLLKGKKDD